MATITNLILNPSAEGTFASTIQNRSSPTVTQDTTWAWAPGRTHSAKVVTPGSVGQEGISFLTASGLGFTGAATAYAPSVYLKGSGSITVNVVVVYTDASNTTSGNATQAATAGGARIAAPSFTINPAKTVNYMRLDVRMNGVIATTFQASGAMLHEGTEPVDYFDGDSPNAEWTGTPHASTSVLTLPDVTRTLYPVMKIGASYIGPLRAGHP